MRQSLSMVVEINGDKADADAMISALATDPRVISIDATISERVYVPVRDETDADFGR